MSKLRVLCLAALISTGCVGTMSGGEGGGTGGTGGTGGSGGSGGSGGAGGGSGVGGGTAGGSGGSGGGSVAGGGAGGAGGGGTGVVDAGTPLTPGDPGTADVRFDVRSDKDVHPISSLIYGSNEANNPAQNRFGVLRLGGNRLTAYNWENNASNAGSDYNYQNDGYLSASNTPGDVVKARVDAAKAINAAALLTIPIVDYVAADKNGGGDVRNTANYLATRFKQNRALKGAALSTTPDAADAFVNQDEFVNWVKTTQTGAKILFSLDNEPDLWSSTHVEIHPAALTYDELCNRDITYGKMVKNVWPTAEVTGFVSYGWNGYTTLQGAPNNGTLGDFTNYWLDKMKAAEVTEGKRVVDYLDLHWYPEAQGGGVRITGPETTAAVVAARTQAPRSLFDPAYTETSWINQALGQPIRLIPRMKEKVAAHYPGTKLAFTEWNFGGGGHISGAVATADVLGVFGREGVQLATFWELNADESYSYAGFRAFRNFDGANGAFGDTSISATTSDVATATVYASLDAAQTSRVVIVAVNKATSAKTAGLTLAHPSRFTRLKVYSVTAGTVNVVAGANVNEVATNAFKLTLPAMSVTVLVPQP